MNRALVIISAIMLAVGSALMTGCSDEMPPRQTDSMPPVIEGWIENGEKPVVIVTRAVDLTQPSDTLEKYIEKWCRVSISDGENTYYLSGKLDKAYTPAFIYTTSRFRGVAGKSYHLKVELDEQTIEADTSIPEPPALDSLTIIRSSMCDTLYQVIAYPHILQGDSGYYKFFTRVRNREKRYFSSFLGTFQGQTYAPRTGISVSRGIHNTFNGTQKFTPHYSLGDTVEIRFCRIDSEAFRFWQDYEGCVSMSGNIFFHAVTECRGNLDNAIGYWFGYGLTRTAVIITED